MKSKNFTNNQDLILIFNRCQKHMDLLDSGTGHFFTKFIVMLFVVCVKKGYCLYFWDIRVKFKVKDRIKKKSTKAKDIRY